MTGLPPVQTPAWQMSVRVQALPSLHAMPSGFAGFEQVPFEGLHVPAAWHWSIAVQTTGGPLWLAPALQVSVSVQALSSVQVRPSGVPGFEQRPVEGLQAPAV